MVFDSPKEVTSSLLSFILGILSVLFIASSHASSGIVSSSITSGPVSAGNVIYYPDDITGDFVVQVTTTEPGTFVAGFPFPERKTCSQVSGRAVTVDSHTPDSETGNQTYDLRVNFSDTTLTFADPIRRFCIKFTPDSDPSNVSAVQVAEIALESEHTVHPASPLAPFHTVLTGDMGLPGGGNVYYVPFWGVGDAGHPLSEGQNIGVRVTEPADVYVTFPIDGVGDCSTLDSRDSMTSHFTQIGTDRVNVGVVVDIDYTGITNDDIPDGSRRLVCVSLSHSPSERTANTTVIGYQVATIERDPRPALTITGIGTTQDTTPDVSFTTTVAGTLTLGGSCATSATAATSGDNTITLHALAFGTYTDCTITVTETGTGQSFSATETIPSFTVSFPVLSADSVYPAAPSSPISAFSKTSGSFSLGGDLAVPSGDDSVFSITLSEAGMVYYGLLDTGSSNTCSSIPRDTLLATVTQAATPTSITLPFFTETLEPSEQKKVCIMVYREDTAAQEVHKTGYEIGTVSYQVSAPDIIVTPIGTTTDTTPDLTFRVNRAGTLSFSGSCSSSTTRAVLGTNTVTLDTLSSGVYSDCSVTVVAGSDTTSVSIPSFTISASDGGGASGQSQAPTPTVTITPIGSTTDTTPDLTFSTDIAGTLTYGGSCSSSDTAATVGSNTVTLTALSVGTYSDCTLTLTTPAGGSATETISSFTVSAPVVPRRSTGSGLEFFINEFTVDRISITIPAGQAVVQGAFSPVGLSNGLFLYDTTAPSNNSWILQTENDPTVQGQIGGLGFDSQTRVYNSGNANVDTVDMFFTSDLSASDTVDTDITFVAAGTNLFDPDAIDTLGLVWGNNGYPSIPWGTVQSSLAVSGALSSAPTVTSIEYEDAADGTGSVITHTGFTDTVYSIVTFSENVSVVVANGSTARPAIAYKTDSTASEVQYDIISSDDTLASGDCKAITGTSVYACMYTGSGLSGTNYFKSYVTAFADTTDISGSAQTYISNDGSVVMGALPRRSSGSGLQFIINDFTTDRLSFTIPAGQTISASGFGSVSLPNGLFLYDTTDPINNGWILQTENNPTVQGQIDGLGFSSQTRVYTNPGVNVDTVDMFFSSDLSAGDTVDTDITFVATGTNLFDPDAIDTLSLVWGNNGYPSIPWGTVQSSLAIFEAISSTPTVTITPIGSTIDATPDLTFSTDMAGTLTYGGSCSSTTTSASVGSNTVTLNTLAVGIYSDCTLTLTTAAGGSATVNIPSFTISVGGGGFGVGVGLGGVGGISPPPPPPPPTVSVTPIGSTTDTTPDLTFNTDIAGTLIYGGSCSSTTTTAAVGSNTVTLNALSVGTYSDCTLALTTAAGGSATVNIPSFTITGGVVNPPPPPTPTVTITPIGSTTDTTPDLTFSTDIAGTLIYGGSCSSSDTAATIGSNTVTLAVLSVGTYSDCTLTLTTPAGGSATVNIPSFTITGGVVNPPLTPTVSVTPIGSTTDTTPDLTFSTDIAGTLTYGGSCSSSDTAATVGSNTVTLNALSVGVYSDCSFTLVTGAGVSAVTAVDPFTISAVSDPDDSDGVASPPDTFSIVPPAVFPLSAPQLEPSDSSVQTTGILRGVAEERVRLLRKLIEVLMEILALRNT